MAALSTTRVPPARVVRFLEKVRGRIVRLTQQMLPPNIALLELALGSVVTQAIYVAAELRIAETLRDGPLTAEEIARRVEANPDAVYRLLRLLASYSIFAEDGNGRFRLTQIGEALRGDTPTSMRGISALMGNPIHWEDWGQLLNSVRTGEPSLPKLRGMGAFEFLGANPEYGAIFFQGMGNLSDLETIPLVAAYDFSPYKTIVDVGGGRGALIAAILQRSARSRGVIFDERAVASGAEDLLAQAGVAERCTIEAGGLFDPVTPGADAYLLKHIIHDWPESQALEILKNVRGAMNPDSTLLLMESVVPTDARRHSAKLVDLWLMLLVGGKERTKDQYSELLASAGFRLNRVVETAAPISIVEARPL